MHEAVINESETDKLLKGLIIMRKLLVLLLTLILVVFSFVSCGSNKDDNTITVAASATPHAEILEQCVEAMKDKGYTLKIEVMEDYVIPNTATEGGDVDANYFQHTPYLDQFNDEQGTHLVSVAKVHYEPYGIYAGTCKNLGDLPNGAKVAVPNDATNEARALMLLESCGLIKLKEGAGLTATKNDIIENKKNLDIKEMEAALIPGVLSDVAMGVINGNYAIGAKLNVADALAVEDAKSTAAQTYANILVVKEGNENNEAVLALKEILLSDEIAKYINDTYKGAVVSMK